MFVVVKIDKTNYPNTEPEDISVKACPNFYQACSWMGKDYLGTEKHENEEIHPRYAFKNDNDHEVLWVIREI